MLQIMHSVLADYVNICALFLWWYLLIGMLAVGFYYYELSSIQLF